MKDPTHSFPTNPTRSPFHKAQALLKDLAAKRWTRIVGSISISIIFLAILLTQFDFSQIDILWSKLNLIWVIPAYASYMASYVVSSMRFSVFFWSVDTSNRISITNLIPVIALQNFFLSILPFRLGELSFLILLRKRFNIQDNLLNLVISRFGDMLSILIFFLVSSIVMVQENPQSISIIPWQSLSQMNLWWWILGIVVGSGLVILLAWRWKILTRILKRLLRVSMIQKMYSVFITMLSSLKQFWQEGSWRFLLIIGYSLLIYFCVYMGNYFFFLSLNTNLTIWQAFFACSIMTLFTVLPINGIAGIGPTDLVILAILLFLGIPNHECGPITIGLHFEFLTFIGLMGLIGWIWFRRIERTWKA